MIKDKIPQKKLPKEDSENGEITIPESVPKILWMKFTRQSKNHIDNQGG